MTGDNDKFLSGDGLTVSGYDSDGMFSTIANSGDAYHLTYDGLNRLATTQNANGTASATFAYDGDGKRVDRIFNGQSTKYVYDGSSLIGTVNSDGSMSYFIPSVGAVWANGPPQYYWQENAQGATLDVRDGSGTLCSRTDFDAFGNPFVAVQGPQSFLGYGGAHGYVTEGDTDWMLMGARYYIPYLGRFLTQDPEGLGSGLNLYSYCDNNPVLNTDSTGMSQDMWPNAGPNTLRLSFAAYIPGKFAAGFRGDNRGTNSHTSKYRIEVNMLYDRQTGRVKFENMAADSHLLGIPRHNSNSDMKFAQKHYKNGNERIWITGSAWNSYTRGVLGNDLHIEYSLAFLIKPNNKITYDYFDATYFPNFEMYSYGKNSDPASNFSTETSSSFLGLGGLKHYF